MQSNTQNVFINKDILVHIAQKSVSLTYALAQTNRYFNNALSLHLQTIYIEESAKEQYVIVSTDNIAALIKRFKSLRSIKINLRQVFLQHTKHSLFTIKNFLDTIKLNLHPYIFIIINAEQSTPENILCTLNFWKTICLEDIKASPIKNQEALKIMVEGFQKNKALASIFFEHNFFKNYSLKSITLAQSKPFTLALINQTLDVFRGLDRCLIKTANFFLPKPKNHFDDVQRFLDLQYNPKYIVLDCTDANPLYIKALCNLFIKRPIQTSLTNANANVLRAVEDIIAKSEDYLKEQDLILHMNQNNADLGLKFVSMR